jgi:hypothetical protein
MLELEDLMQLLREAALPRREKAGASKSLRAALSGIAQSAARLSADLQRVRFELLYRRLLGEECTTLDRLHIALHDSVSFWNDPSRLSGDVNHPTRSTSASHMQRGGTAMTSETWLELGFNSMSAKASRALLDETEFLKHLGSRSARIREGFVRRVALAWVEAVGVRPTVRGEGEKLSPFQIFYSQVCGHSAGLLARDSGWANLRTADRLTFKSRLQALGLLVLPSASTLRRVMKSASEIPRTKGGKDGA